MSFGTEVQPSVPLESKKEHRPPGFVRAAELHSAVTGRKSGQNVHLAYRLTAYVPALANRETLVSIS
jgi:hypothetical protein